MGLLLWIVFGALVGWVASLIMKSDTGLLWDIIIGMVGAVLGGFIMSLLGQGGVSSFNVYGFLVALLGACIFIGILRAARHQ